MPTCPTLTTERLVMRPFRADDLDPLFAIMTTDPVRTSFHVPDSYARTDTWQTLAAFAGLWELRGLGPWALEERETGRFVGRAGLYWRAEPEWPGVEVGWLLDPAVWGRGYATEAGARAVRYGVEDLGEDTLYSVILPENTRSGAVATRLGFTPWEERVLPHFPSMAHMVWRRAAVDRAAADRAAADRATAGLAAADVTGG